MPAVVMFSFTRSQRLLSHIFIPDWRYLINRQQGYQGCWLWVTDKLKSFKIIWFYRNQAIYFAWQTRRWHHARADEARSESDLTPFARDLFLSTVCHAVYFRASLTFVSFLCSLTRFLSAIMSVYLSVFLSLCLFLHYSCFFSIFSSLLRVRVHAIFRNLKLRIFSPQCLLCIKYSY